MHIYLRAINRFNFVCKKQLIMQYKFVIDAKGEKEKDKRRKQKGAALLSQPL